MREVKREERKPTLGDKLDSLVAIFAPGVGLRRQLFRELARSAKLTAYRSRSKTNTYWMPGGGSADADLLGELPDLREKSRDLVRKDPHAAGLADSIGYNVVGTGIRPQARPDLDALGMTEEQGKQFTKAAEGVWRRWSTMADYQEKIDFDEIELLVMRQILENGEVLIIPRFEESVVRPYLLSLEVIEADRLGTPPNKKMDGAIRDGVEYNEKGQVTAYHIKKTHPGDAGLNRTAYDDYVRIPAWNPLGHRNVMHLFPCRRPGQSRGVPFFAPALDLFKNLADYIDGELVSMKVASYFAAFVTTENPYDQATGRYSRTEGTGATYKQVESLEQGAIEYLAPGQTIKFPEHNRPGLNFDAFVERILRGIGASLGLPYEMLTKDFSKTNYSSARAALIEAVKFFGYWQSWLGKRLCQPTWEMLLQEAWLRDELPAPDFLANKQEFCRARWIAPGRPWVDPLKEAQASREGMLINVTTLADECASQGADWEEVLEQRARENAKIKELGLTPVTDKKGGTDKEKKNGNGDNQDDEGGKDDGKKNRKR